jgi:putrescine transport system substrate-binding protein
MGIGANLRPLKQVMGWHGTEPQQEFNTMKNKASVYLAMTLALGFNASRAVPLHAQGMLSAPESSKDIASEGLGGFTGIKPQEISTIQRLLRRLGYLADGDMTRKMDAETVSALLAFFRDANTSPNDMTAGNAIRSLFSTAWTKEGWATGRVKGQDLVVGPERVLAAQDALTRLGYVPGPVDGSFGPATLSAVETFQEDNDMEIIGLLTDNTAQNIERAVKFSTSPPASTVRVLAWPKYIDPKTLDEFEVKTNIRVVLDVYDEAEKTEELLLQGTTKYDVVMQTGDHINRVLKDENAMEILDRPRLPNLRYLDPTALGFAQNLDPGNARSVPYLWGTFGIAANRKITERIRPGLAFDSLAIFLDPAIAADLSKCGIAIMDEPYDVIPLFVNYLGGDMRSVGITDLESVELALAKVSRYFQVVSDEELVEGLAGGKYCVGFGYSGEIFRAHEKSKTTVGADISYRVPKEGSQLWFDFLVIPSKAQNKDGAYQLIDHLMKPDVAGRNTNYAGFANANLASAKYINPRLLGNPGLYPPESALGKLAVQPALSKEVEQRLQQIWAKLSRK